MAKMSKLGLLPERQFESGNPSSIETSRSHLLDMEVNIKPTSQHEIILPSLDETSLLAFRPRI
jgi:hypothetical protein